MKCIQKSNNMWAQCYAQGYKAAETFMPRAGRKKSQGVNINIVNLICHVSELFKTWDAIKIYCISLCWEYVIRF